MTKRTQIILLCAAVLLIVMCLFPPQHVTYSGMGVTMRTPLRDGYYFVNKDWSEESSELKEGWLFSEIDYQQLTYQGVLLLAFTCALLLLLDLLGRRKRRRILDIAD